MKLYNSLTRQVEPFTPIDPPNVRMYVCGVTVYDHCHMGHARAYVAFDLLKRVLIHSGYKVQHIQNFTDIDDKIIQRSLDTNTPCKTITDTFIQAYFDDMSALNILNADHYPKATESIEDMIQLIQSLIDNKSAYAINGSVYFRISACNTYGELSKKDIDDLKSGHRVAIEEQKESPLDFILWKPSKEGEPSWNSPWGQGRPGWHTECVAMVNHHLGPHIDIHGGGTDLQFPHHENELAQAKCAFHTPFANVWVHNGFVTINNEKMSKSLNNFFTLKDVLTSYDADVLRFFLMRTHYRAPLNYSMETLNDAKAAYQKLTAIFDIVEDRPIPSSLQTVFDSHHQQFWQALTNDLNISEALAELFTLHGLVHQHQCGVHFFKDLGQAIGLFYRKKPSVPKDILSLADQRWQAKQAKNFRLADQIRNDIEAKGYVVEDTAEGVRIRF